MAIRTRILIQRARRLSLIVLAFAQAQTAFGQTPAPPAEPPPPPRLEASAQLAFLDTRGNATTQSLGAGGDVVWRPDPWTFTAKAAFAQNETEGELTSRSLAALLRGSRALNGATSELTYEPRYLLPLAETDAWKFDQKVALVVAVNTTLALKLSHTLRYSAEPQEGFATTDTIMAVSLVAKLQRPR